MDWNSAVEYCKNLNEDEHNDWRLPNIDELRTLIINNPLTERYGSCKISDKAGKLSSYDFTDDCDGIDYGNHSKLEDRGWFWSSSKTDLMEMFHHFLWFVNFNNGSIYYGDEIENYNVRCVRNAD